MLVNAWRLGYRLLFKLPYWLYLHFKGKKKIKNFYEFQHINQLRDFLYWLNSNEYELQNKGYKQINLYGTPKLHGTNIGIIFKSNGEYTLQTRNRIITKDNDHFGFYKWMTQDKINYIYNHFKYLFDNRKIKAIIVYGEFAGKGVQKGVAISQIERFYAPFAVRIITDKDDYYIKPRSMDFNLWNDELRIYNLFNPKYFVKVNVDKSNLEEVINIIDEYVKECEVEDKFAIAFGMEGIGEGIVWDYEIDGKTYFFKTKIDEFKTKAQKVNKNKTIDEIKEDKKIIEYCLNEYRLRQGIEYMNENGIDTIIQNIKDFITWVVEDTIREEERFILDNGLNEKRVRKLVGTEAAKWYKQQLNTVFTVKGE